MQPSQVLTLQSKKTLKINQEFFQKGHYLRIDEGDFKEFVIAWLISLNAHSKTLFFPL